MSSNSQNVTADNQIDPNHNMHHAHNNKDCKIFIFRLKIIKQIFRCENNR